MKTWEIIGTIIFIVVIIAIAIGAVSSKIDSAAARQLCEKDGHIYWETEHLGGMFETGRFNAICINEVCDGDYCDLEYYKIKVGGN